MTSDQQTPNSYRSHAYAVWHYCAKVEDSLDYCPDKEDGQFPRRIGVFSSRSRALEAVERCKQQAGFRDWPESFDIEAWEIGTFGWEDGFVGWWEEENE